MAAHRIGTVTLADTGEEVPELSILKDDHETYGHDWRDDIEDHGWGAVGLWGRDGYDLGDWPYVIVAVTSAVDVNERHVYGVAQYIEGDVRCHYYRAKAEAWKTITRYAFETWTQLGNGPKDLPATVEELAHEFRVPVQLNG